MQTMNPMRGVFAAIAATVWGLSPAHAVDTTWDGNGDSNSGGNWSVGANWNSDAAPTTADRAILPSVSTGLRTVTQDTAAGTTANVLRFEQATAAGTNKLSLGGNLTLSLVNSQQAATGAFQVSLTSGATAENVHLDLNGNRVVVSLPNNSSTGGILLGGTVNFNQAGSRVGTADDHRGWFGITVAGTVNVTADGSFAHPAYNATAGMNATFGTGSKLTIENATFDVLQGALTTGRTLLISNSGTFDIKADATLSPRVLSNSAGSGGHVSLVNASGGSVNQAGRIELKTSASGLTFTPMATLLNSGTWTVAGGNAVIRRRDSSTITMPAFTNQAAGTLRGSSASDTLEFNEETSDGTRRMTVTNNGLMAPGAGSQGDGTASVGALILRDINVAMGSTGKVYMDLGGSAAGQHDQLLLQTGAVGPAGAGTLDLTNGGTLQLYSVNGFTPGASFTVTLIAAGSVSGQFATVKLDGATFVANELLLPDGTRYVLGYTADAVQLSYVGQPSGTVILLL